MERVRSRSIPGWKHEEVFAQDVNRATRCLREWRRQGIGPAWAKFGNDVYYRDDAAQTYLEANEKKPVRSRRAA